MTDVRTHTTVIVPSTRHGQRRQTPRFKAQATPDFTIYRLTREERSSLMLSLRMLRLSWCLGMSIGSLPRTISRNSSCLICFRLCQMRSASVPHLKKRPSLVQNLFGEITPLGVLEPGGGGMLKISLWKFASRLQVVELLDLFPVAPDDVHQHPKPETGSVSRSESRQRTALRVLMRHKFDMEKPLLPSPPTRSYTHPAPHPCRTTPNTRHQTRLAPHQCCSDSRLPSN